MALEELLLEECKDDPPSQWGTMERLSPLLYTWAQVGARSWLADGGGVEGAPGHPCHWLVGRVRPPARSLAAVPVEFALRSTPLLCVLWLAAGPDQHAGRLDGTHSRLRGLDPRVQAARPWLPVGGVVCVCVTVPSGGCV